MKKKKRKQRPTWNTKNEIDFLKHLSPEKLSGYRRSFVLGIRTKWGRIDKAKIAKSLGLKNA